MYPMQAVPAPPYTSADFQAIANALDLSSDVFETVFVCVQWPSQARGEPLPRSPHTITLAPLTDALQAAAQWYLLHKDPNNIRLRPADQRRALTNLDCLAARLMNTAQDFRKALEELDPASFDQLWRHRQHPYKALEEMQRITDKAELWVVETVSYLPGLQNLLAAALESISADQGGRPRTPALQLFIQRLCAIYECATGRCSRLSLLDGKQPYGFLFRFVEACLIPLKSKQGDAEKPEWGDAEKQIALYQHIRSVLQNAHRQKKSV
jgi:hypothetical protein